MGEAILAGLFVNAIFSLKVSIFDLPKLSAESKQEKLIEKTLTKIDI